MKSNFNLSEYMSSGIENIVKGVVKASFKNPKETAFLLKYALWSKEAKKRRESFVANGENVPAFLISSITSSCNLFCKGCYARENKSCGESSVPNEMSIERWGKLFNEAKELGVSFILLAGGEPLMRRNVIEKAAKLKEIIFPIFTNGTMLNEEYIKLLDKNRNLVPMLSIEGDREQTDSRRGNGTYNILMNVMGKLKEKGILYGASVTVTTENFMTVSSSAFFDKLYTKGCRALIYVEYVPVIESTRQLAPTDYERGILEGGQQKLREQYEDVIFLSFPGDEKYSGGCLAAGRGFFHINVDGCAEPCPFSPYSDTNLKDCTLREALKSPLFRKLSETGLLLGEHDGGCLLFEKEKEVKELINNKR
ncbi:radical SAM protein [Clostridium algoriphilum]|uniref:radical SAM protein n=1 Tax=Clostridium algoriphilum TaxID=198347 RepID=UPI001CF5F46A|nr:radical SAM protein [Clostridium algoriphilum]MCB2295475.1 radical SAM protein [Clostridium algoriphilum]